MCYALSAVAETFSVICQDWCAAINSNDFDCERLIPLLSAVLNKESDDAIWAKVYVVAAESTPPPRPLPFLDQTPYLYTTSSFVNSSERQKHVDTVLKEELGIIYVRIPDFYDAYFRGVDDLDKASAAVLRRCKEGDRPLFSEGNGWRDWPDGAKEKEVLDWLSALINVAREIATEEGFTTAPCSPGVEPSCPRWACAPPDWSVALAPPSYPPRVLPVRACVGIQPPDMVLPMFPTSAL